jgi:hypothetical protein
MHMSRIVFGCALVTSFAQAELPSCFVALKAKVDAGQMTAYNPVRTSLSRAEAETLIEDLRQFKNLCWDGLCEIRARFNALNAFDKYNVATRELVVENRNPSNAPGQYFLIHRGPGLIQFAFDWHVVVEVMVEENGTISPYIIDFPHSKKLVPYQEWVNSLGAEGDVKIEPNTYSEWLKIKFIMELLQKNEEAPLHRNYANLESALLELLQEKSFQLAWNDFYFRRLFLEKSSLTDKKIFADWQKYYHQVVEIENIIAWVWESLQSDAPKLQQFSELLSKNNLFFIAGPEGTVAREKILSELGVHVPPADFLAMEAGLFPMPSLGEIQQAALTYAPARTQAPVTTSPAVRAENQHLPNISQRVLRAAYVNRTYRGDSFLQMRMAIEEACKPKLPADKKKAILSRFGLNGIEQENLLQSGLLDTDVELNPYS